MTPARGRPANVHLQGLLGVAGAIAALGLFLLLLHVRRNGLPVDPAELQFAADSPCMVQALHAQTRTPTYGELDRLKRRCGE